MNAKELHDIYAPLWEKVPETSPGKAVLWWDEKWSAFQVCWGDGSNNWSPSPDVVVAALCRVTVDDWLRVRGRFIMTPRDGETIHHALVHAAMENAGTHASPRAT